MDNYQTLNADNWDVNRIWL